ncbi:MAG: M23 family metallopeptidase [Desulfobacteraceae bacterium]|nr:M23 family metallopeptidase [Desulfobacteraceae bacterium]
MSENLIILKPVDTTKTTITSRYWSWRWKRMCWHRAYDFAPVGNNRFCPNVVYAGIPGLVVQIYHELKGFGLYVKIKHWSLPIYAYKAHLREVLVKEGDFVEATQSVGVMGNSGNSYSLNGGDGTHLHDEYREVTKRGDLWAFNAASYYKDWNPKEVKIGA